MKLSVIIPAYNEQEIIAQTISTVKAHSAGKIAEIIVIDGGSNDKTVARAKSAGARVEVSSKKGRAAQMNAGAKHAHAEILYFLHADSTPPHNFDLQIEQAFRREYQAGCFQLSFDENHWLLRSYAWFTRFDINAFRFGDQSLFITSRAFEVLNGFRDDHLLMEDNEIVRRIKKEYAFTVLNDRVTTSARSYRKVGIVKLQLVFALIFVLYFLGVEQEKLADVKKWALSSS